MMASHNPHMRSGKAGLDRPTKVAGHAKGNIAECFERLGGVEAMAKWARKHPAKFYCKIYPRLIGVDVQAAKTDDAVKKEDNSAREALGRIFEGIWPQDKTAVQQISVVNDHDPDGGAAPELVRTNGSAAVRKD